MPVCTKCNTERPPEAFKPDKRTKTGLAKVCTPCKTPPKPRFVIVYYPRTTNA